MQATSLGIYRSSFRIVCLQWRDFLVYCIQAFSDQFRFRSNVTQSKYTLRYYIVKDNVKAKLAFALIKMNLKNLFTPSKCEREREKDQRIKGKH